MSSFKKVIMNSHYIHAVFIMLACTMFAIKTCIMFFLQEEFDFPLQVKPLTMVLTVVLKLYLNILVRR